MGKRWQKRLYKLEGFLKHLYSLMMLRYTKFNFGILRQQLTALPVERLHIGCGHVILDGWLNVLYERRLEYGRIINKGKALFLNYNLLNEWPVPGNSLRFVSGSHVIEHLDLNQGLQLARCAYDALQVNGVIRLSCPDLEIYARNYLSRNDAFFNNSLIREWCAFKSAQTHGQIFVAKAYDSGGAHKWFYDFESLKNILERVGFKDVKRVGRLEGQTPDLGLLEPPQRELETVYVEAVK